MFNLVGAGLMGGNHELLEGDEFNLLALLQGVPMLLDVPLRRQHEAQNH